MKYSCNTKSLYNLSQLKLIEQDGTEICEVYV